MHFSIGSPYSPLYPYINCPCVTASGCLCRHEAVVEDLSEFLNDGSWKRGYNVKRSVIHTSCSFLSTCIYMHGCWAHCMPYKLVLVLWCLCRQYYHSHTCLPMVPEEIDQDSEVELESIGRWQKICSQKVGVCGVCVCVCVCVWHCSCLSLSPSLDDRWVHRCE